MCRKVWLRYNDWRPQMCQGMYACCCVVAVAACDAAAAGYAVHAGVLVGDAAEGPHHVRVIELQQKVEPASTRC
jgi:hypothetical protein